MISIIISIVALIISLGALAAQIYDNKKNVNSIFANLWFDLDQMFIDHPHMHKYFYVHDINDGQKSVTSIVPGDDDYELALCMAERIVDVFQYAELFKDSLNKKDKESYELYKNKMFSSEFMSTIVRNMWTDNGSKWIEIQSKNNESIKR